MVNEDNLADETKTNADEALIVETVEEAATNDLNITENKIEKSYYASAMITVEYLSYLTVIWVTFVTFDRGL